MAAVGNLQDGESQGGVLHSEPETAHAQTYSLGPERNATHRGARLWNTPSAFLLPRHVASVKRHLAKCIHVLRQLHVAD